jgi:hypothetical protein
VLALLDRIEKKSNLAAYYLSNPLVLLTWLLMPLAQLHDFCDENLTITKLQHYKNLWFL